MLGGFTGATTLAMTGNFWLALLAAALVIAVFGAALQIVATLRPLLGRDRSPPSWPPSASPWCCRSTRSGGGPPPARSRAPRPASSRCSTCSIPWYRILTAVLAAAIIATCTYSCAMPSTVSIRATTQDRIMAQAMGIPVPLVSIPRSAIGAAIAARAACCWPPGRRRPEHGLRLHPARLHRGGRGGYGESRRSILGLDLSQHAGGLRFTRDPLPARRSLFRSWP